MSVKKKITELTTRPPFKGLFPTDPEVLAEITASIKADGYDITQPIYVWKDPDTGELVVVDGHTRLDAAKAAKLTEVQVVVRKFADEAAAFEFAVKNQRARRNITKQQIADAIARAELTNSHHGESAKSVGLGRGRGKTPDPVRQAVLTKTAEHGISRPVADRAISNAKAEKAAANGDMAKARKTRTARPTPPPTIAELNTLAADAAAAARTLNTAHKKWARTGDGDDATGAGTAAMATGELAALYAKKLAKYLDHTIHAKEPAT